MSTVRLRGPVQVVRPSSCDFSICICRRIVEEMDGSISATNRAEGGACFEILLPAAVNA